MTMNILVNVFKHRHYLPVTVWNQSVFTVFLKQILSPQYSFDTEYWYPTLVVFHFEYIYQVIAYCTHQLLFLCEKISWDLREAHYHNYPSSKARYGM
jgi:hypothetical protein